MAALLASLTLGMAASSTAPPRARIFVYDLPRSFNLGLLDADVRVGNNVLCDNDCSFSQWASEVMLHAWLLQHPARTLEPEEADLFFVPYYIAMDQRLQPNGGRLRSRAHEALYRRVAFRDGGVWTRVANQTDRWWRRRGGRDHVMVLSKEPARVSPLGMVTYFASKAGASGTLAPGKEPPPQPPWLSRFGAVEVQMLATELPPGADTKRHIVLPYPQLGPYWTALARQQPEPPTAGASAAWASTSRPVFAFFYGSVHGGFGERYRRKVLRALRAEKDCVAVEFTGRAGVKNGTVHAKNAGWRERMRQSVFCPVVGGDTRNSRRLYAAVLSGCVPVLVGAPHEVILPFGWAIAPDEWTLSVPDKQLMSGRLISTLRALPAAQLERLRAGVRRARALTWWEWPYSAGANSSHAQHVLKRLARQMHELAHALPARDMDDTTGSPVAQRRQHNASRSAEDPNPAGAVGGLQPQPAASGTESEPSLVGGVFGGAFDVLWMELESRALRLRHAHDRAASPDPSALMRARAGDM